MKRKIAFILTAMNIGGTEKALLNLIDTIPPKEYEVTILLLQKKGGFLSEIPSWVTVKEVADYVVIDYEISTPPIQLVKTYLKKGRFFRAMGIAYRHFVFRITCDRSGYFSYVLRGHKLNEHYDTAIAFEGPEDFISSFVLDCVLSTEKIQWIHFDVSKYLFHIKTAKKLYPKFQKICVVSDEARQALINLVPEIEAKTKTVHNVISDKRCQELAVKGIGFTDKFDGIRILTVGRLSEEKGQDIIPEIAKQLKENGVLFRWYLIGEGILRESVEKKISEYHLEDKVVLLGEMTNPYPFYKDADIYVQTSLHEGFCITLAEAKVFRLKIVSTECLGAHEQLDRYANSVIVPREINAMTYSLKEYLKKEEK